MRQAILNIKPLLIKWTIVCIVGIGLLNASVIGSAKINFSNEAAAKNKITSVVHFSQKDISDDHQPTVKIPNMLPPFQSESDTIKAATRKSNRSALNLASSGNTYYRGYCTWYAKFKRPDLPNSLGNANTWFARAQALGIPAGIEAKVGAIGQQGNHVVYVEKVNGDDTVSISEMNYRGFGIVSTRTVPKTSFSYIY